MLEQRPVSMTPSRKIARRDLARVMVAAVGNARNKTFNVYEGEGPPQDDAMLAAQLAELGTATAA